MEIHINYIGQDLNQLPDVVLSMNLPLIGLFAFILLSYTGDVSDFFLWSPGNFVQQISVLMGHVGRMIPSLCL